MDARTINRASLALAFSLGLVACADDPGPTNSNQNGADSGMTETDAGTDSGADMGGDPDAADSCPEGTEALDGECVESGLVISVLGNRGTFTNVVGRTIEIGRDIGEFEETTVTDRCSYSTRVSEGAEKTIPDCYNAGELTLSDGTATFRSGPLGDCYAEGFEFTDFRGTLEASLAGGPDIDRVAIALEVPEAPDVTVDTLDDGFRINRNNPESSDGASYILLSDAPLAPAIFCGEEVEGELVFTSADLQAIAEVGTYDRLLVLHGRSQAVAVGERFFTFSIQDNLNLSFPPE